MPRSDRGRAASLCLRRCARRAIVAVLATLGSATLAVAHKPPKPGSKACLAYFAVLEQDGVTMGLPMVGLDKPQRSWYRKHGGDFPRLCFAAGDAAGVRVTVGDASQAYWDSLLRDPHPFYLIAWEEHAVFVPDPYGGHYAWSANGIVSWWDSSSQKFVPVGPIHNTNRTILTSSATSLLKAGLRAIRRREKAMGQGSR